MMYEYSSKPAQRWWEGQGDSYEVFKWIEQHDGDRKADYQQFYRLYSNRDVVGFGPASYGTRRSGDRVSLNITKSVVDTVCSRIARNRPRPRFLTTGGNHSLQRKARLLERWVDAQCYTTKLYKIAPIVFRDACIFGTGVLKVFARGKEVVAERVFPGELFVDRSEGLYGCPRQLHQRKFMDRGELKAMFPKKAEEIEKHPALSTDDASDYTGYDAAADGVEVVMSWRLPSGKGAGDGRYVIKLKDVVLYEEKYSKDHFPFVVLHWSDAVRGYWGQGLVDELVGLQVEINKLLQKIQTSMHLISNPQWWVEQSSKVRPGSMTTTVGQVNRYVGTPPVVYTPTAMPAETYQHLERLIQRAYEIAGVSRLSAGSMKPAGLESGAALREYNDIETERFALASRAWEEFFMEVARHMVGVGRDISKRYPNYTVVAQRDRMTIEEVKWAEVDLETDAYVLQVFPSSSLPSEPAGRISTVADLLAMQLISPEEGKHLLGFPDLEANLALDRAASENTDRLIEQMVDEGRYEAPEPFGDLELSLKKAQAKYNQLLCFEDIPEERLKLLRRFMTALSALIEKRNQQVMAQAGGASAPLPGAPPTPGPTGQMPTAVGPQDGTIA